MQVNVHEAKTHLSRLLQRVEQGEEVIISRGGKPVAKLIRIKSLIQPRKVGSAAGLFTVPDDFNAPLPPDIEESFWR